VIRPSFTSPAFRGAIVLAPFFGPDIACRRPFFTEPAVGLALGLTAPCAISYLVEREVRLG
jgi:hypothetical protein